jgi:hypothetical protein
LKQLKLLGGNDEVEKPLFLANGAVTGNNGKVFDPNLKLNGTAMAALRDGRRNIVVHGTVLSERRRLIKLAYRIIKLDRSWLEGTMAKRQGWWVAGGAIAAFVGGGLLYASPYLTLYQMYQAVERRDARAISNSVDFPALRESVKENLQSVVLKQTAKQNNPILNLIGAALGSALADPVLDRLVTPEGVMALLEGQRLQAGADGGDRSLSEQAVQVDVNPRYESFDRFVVSVKPKGEDVPPVDVVLSREGLGWKITGVRLPKFRNSIRSHGFTATKSTVSISSNGLGRPQLSCLCFANTFERLADLGWQD